MQRLRAQGLTLAEIASQLGVSRQAVHGALRHQHVKRDHAVCCYCLTPIPTADRTGHVQNVACSNCLATRPTASFAQGLISLRIAAGLTQGALAQGTGLSQSLISLLEHGAHNPRPRIRELLLAFLERALSKAQSA